MKRSSNSHARRSLRRINLAEILRIGISPIPMWVSVLVAIFITVSAFDDVRLFVLTNPQGFLPRQALVATVLYWTLWMSLAFKPRPAPYAFVLLLVAILSEDQPGGMLLLAFGGLAISAYRVSTRGLVVMVGTFLIWQLAWAFGASTLGAAGLWGMVPATLLVIAPGLAVKVLRERALRVARVQRASEETAARAALEQRTALARELHDVVTHGLTMIAVQANLGTITQDSDERGRALKEIGSMARNSLDDLRRLLQTMRTEDLPVGVESGSRVEPSSATIDLERSIVEAQKRLSGLGFPTTIETSGDVERTPKGLRSTVLRILQESTTNVAKHSGPGTTCEIFLSVHEDFVELLVRNRMTAGKPRLPVSGTGLAGLRERTSRLGGTLDAGSVDGWWNIRAILPLAGRRTLH